jgi:hypothetical protein
MLLLVRQALQEIMVGELSRRFFADKAQVLGACGAGAGAGSSGSPGSSDGAVDTDLASFRASCAAWRDACAPLEEEDHRVDKEVVEEQMGGAVTMGVAYFASVSMGPFLDALLADLAQATVASEKSAMDNYGVLADWALQAGYRARVLAVVAPNAVVALRRWSDSARLVTLVLTVLALASATREKVTSATLACLHDCVPLAIAAIRDHGLKASSSSSSSSSKEPGAGPDASPGPGSGVRYSYPDGLGNQVFWNAVMWVRTSPDPFALSLHTSGKGGPRLVDFDRDLLLMAGTTVVHAVCRLQTPAAMSVEFASAPAGVLALVIQQAGTVGGLEPRRTGGAVNLLGLQALFQLANSGCWADVVLANRIMAALASALQWAVGPGGLPQDDLGWEVAVVAVRLALLLHTAQAKVTLPMMDLVLGHLSGLLQAAAAHCMTSPAAPEGGAGARAGSMRKLVAGCILVAHMADLQLCTQTHAAHIPKLFAMFADDTSSMHDVFDDVPRPSSAPHPPLAPASAPKGPSEDVSTTYGVMQMVMRTMTCVPGRHRHLCAAHGPRSQLYVRDADESEEAPLCRNVLGPLTKAFCEVCSKAPPPSCKP